MNDTKRGRKPVQVDLERLCMMMELGVPKTRIAIDLKVSRKTLYKIIEGFNNG